MKHLFRSQKLHLQYKTDAYWYNIQFKDGGEDGIDEWTLCNDDNYDPSDGIIYCVFFTSTYNEASELYEAFIQNYYKYNEQPDNHDGQRDNDDREDGDRQEHGSSES